MSQQRTKKYKPLVPFLCNGTCCIAVQGEDSRILCRFLISRLSSGSDEDRSYKFHRRKGFAWKNEFPKGVRGYPGRQRLVRLPVSIKCLEWPARHAACGFGLQQTPKHPAEQLLEPWTHMTNLVILLRQTAYTTRCKNSARLNLLNLFDIRDKSAIVFKDLSA